MKDPVIGLNEKKTSLVFFVNEEAVKILHTMQMNWVG
jgi:hypothetical protein